MANRHGVLALQLLELILEKKHPGMLSPSTELRFPFGQLGDLKGVVNKPLLNDPNYSELLSYCACLHLAVWINETNGEPTTAEGVEAQGRRF